MSWTIRLHPATRKDLHRFSPEGRNFILNEVIPTIAQNPFENGTPLHGPLKGFWKHQEGEDRIAYEIEYKTKEVVIIEIGHRGGFYERLRRRLRK